MDCDKEELEATRNRGKDINKSIVIVKRLRDETKDALKCIYITDNKQWKEEAEALDQVLAYIEKLEKTLKIKNGDIEYISRKIDRHFVGKDEIRRTIKQRKKRLSEGKVTYTNKVRINECNHIEKMLLGEVKNGIGKNQF